jgi:WhiB family transcriptional regulator, redox-sensing transcriptional regulator
VPTPPMAVPAMAGEPTWRADARCRHDSAVHFFAPGHLERRDDKRRREEAARALCAACPVQVDCLDYALVVQEPHGIWGGLNELERRRLLRRRAEAPATAGPGLPAGAPGA